MILEIKNNIPENNKENVYQIYFFYKDGNELKSYVEFAKYYDNDWHYTEYLGHENSNIDIHKFTHYNDTPLDLFFPWNKLSDGQIHISGIEFINN